MRVEQFVMAYQAEQDRLRAMLPEGFFSLRPVLRINGEARGQGESRTFYLEWNTPVSAFGRRGWLNIAHWESLETPILYEREGPVSRFVAPFLEIAFTRVGIEGGCPAEPDNEGCFYLGKEPRFAPAETIDRKKEFCDCAFGWRFAPGNASGLRIGGKTLPAHATPPAVQYPRRPFTPEEAANIPCQQILGAYAVVFDREA